GLIGVAPALDMAACGSGYAESVGRALRRYRDCVSIVRVLIVFSCGLACDCGQIGRSRPRYGLPISLGLSVDAVHKTLGGPTAVVRDSETRRQLLESGVQRSLIPPTDNTTEWYNSSGIACTFERDTLFQITLFESASYQGFVPYSGEIVDGIHLTDDKAAV